MQKRSDKKEYCPGYLDLTFGGLVGIEEADKETEVIILNFIFYRQLKENLKKK